MHKIYCKTVFLFLILQICAFSQGFVKTFGGSDTGGTVQWSRTLGAADALVKGLKVSGQSLKTGVVWDGKDPDGNPVNSGVYWVRCKAGNAEIQKKAFLIK